MAKRLLSKIEMKTMMVTGLVFFSIVSIAPLLWMLTVSLRPDAELYSSSFTFWPKQITFQHYVDLFMKTEFKQYYKNSILVTSLVTLISVTISTLAAYSITRFSYRGRLLLSRSVLFVYLIPSSILVVPLYVVMGRLGMLNTKWALVLIYPVFAMPFSTWLLIGYFSSIPREMEDASLVDGCTRLTALFKVLLPVASPGIISAAIYTFTLSWNELLYALAFLDSASQKTLPPGIAEMLLGDITLWGRLMAAGLLTSIPVAILYMFLQRFLVSGLTAGAVKG